MGLKSVLWTPVADFFANPLHLVASGKGIYGYPCMKGRLRACLRLEARTCVATAQTVHQGHISSFSEESNRTFGSQPLLYDREEYYKGVQWHFGAWYGLKLRECHHWSTCARSEENFFRDTKRSF